jgi:hypothetical protein
MRSRFFVGKRKGSSSRFGLALLFLAAGMALPHLVLAAEEPAGNGPSGEGEAAAASPAESAGAATEGGRQAPAESAPAGSTPTGPPPAGPAPADFPIPATHETPPIRTGYRTSLESPLQFKAPSPINRLEEKIGYPIDGSLSARYRLRLSGSESDQDLFQVLSVQAGDREKNKVSGAFLGRLSEDIDGMASGGSYHRFGEITDSYDDNVNGRFYLGYVDLRKFALEDRLAVDTVRVGRQSFDESAEPFVFDGGRIDTKAFEKLKDLRFSAYGGLPAHYYESSPSGDAVVGVGAEASPIRRGRVRVDWTYVEDRRESLFDEGEAFRHKDHLVSAAFWQGFGDRFNVHGRYNLLDGESRDYLVRGTYREAPHDFFLQASFHHVVKVLRDFSTELDPYYSILREYKPFWEVDIHASKGIGRHVVVDGGIFFRELVDSEDESTFNHEFRRFFLTPGTRDWPWEGMSLSVTGDLWDADDTVLTAGAEVSQRFLKALVASFGSYYSLYRVDYLTGDERTHDRTFFWKLEYQVLKDLKLMGMYELERDDFDTYHTVELGLRYTF